MLDIAGLTLDDDDRRRLRSPLTGGVILFSRNYESPAQLKALINEIRASRKSPLVIAVDQEGGRVQRFREHFQSLPALGRIGSVYDQHPQKATELAETFAWIMASELLYYGIDLSFSPVLDIANPISSVIGDRAFHGDPEVVAHLANAWIRGMKRAGMEAVGKHFPGHGSVEGDSHHVMPFDRRGYAEIEQLDLVSFHLVIATHLSAVMMAHVIYDQVDSTPAGYSRHWIEKVLREAIGFDGVVFSDDLSMRGAEVAGDYAARAKMALAAGCDMLLVCNSPAGVDEVLDSLAGYTNPVSQLRMVRLQGQAAGSAGNLFESALWRQSIDELDNFNQQTGLSVNEDLFES